MKKIKLIYLILVAINLNACVISEDNVSTEIIYAPKLDIKFETDENFSLYSNGRVFLYDPQGVLCVDTIISDGGMSGEIKLVHGVEAGVYNLLVFCNANDAAFENVQIRHNKLGQLRLTSPIVNGNKIFYQQSQYELKRGNPQMSAQQSKPLFYNLTIKLTDIDKLTIKPNNPWVEISGISNTIDAMAVPVKDSAKTVRLPQLTSVNDKVLQTSCTITKFTADDNVRITIKELLKNEIETVTINPEEHIDPESNTPQELIIELRYKAYSFELIINDWIMGEYEFAEMGG